MRRLALVAGIAAATLIPGLAAAQSCEQQRSNQTAGTVAGAVIGGVIGSQVAGRHNRTEGAVAGAVVGGVIGNQATRPDADCRHAYGWFDSEGRWHANQVDRSMASGYWDRDGNWVSGKPNGYYAPDRHWVASNGDPEASGYYDDRGRWIPASVDGYYDMDGQWVSARRASGGDRGGYGRGDDMSRDSDRGGGYDRGGRGPMDTASRERWLEQRIMAGRDDRSLSGRDARQALATLNYIRRRESGMRYDDGTLAREDEADIQARLDRLSATLRQSQR